MNRVDATAEWFSKKGDDGTSLYNFWEATNGAGSITIENSILYKIIIILFFQ